MTTSVEYRCAVVREHSKVVVATEAAERARLPRVRIPTGTRIVRGLREAIKSHLGLEVFILQIWFGNQACPCVVAEQLAPATISGFREIPIEQLETSEFYDDERCRLDQLLQGSSKSTFDHLGSIDEAITWLESATDRHFSSKSNIEQWNAGEGFALVRARSDDDRHYWVKATGEPNIHEFAITLLLSNRYPAFLPKLVATNSRWNAWLTEHAGDPLPDPPSKEELISAANKLAELQVQSGGRTEELLTAGAFDQRLPALRNHIDRVISFLIEAMARQTSTKVAPLRAVRLLELGEMLHIACSRQAELDIPDALIHNDLNAGNILWDGKNCVFTDWCEAAIGNPFLSCERLCQLNRVHAECIRSEYRKCWSNRLSMEHIDEAIVLSPLLAIYACLYGRGDWLSDTRKVRPQFESYARSLARHMDRATLNPILMERLCR